MNYGEGARLDYANWEDPVWRLSNLYFILNDHGHEVKFVPNEVQMDFLENLWHLNIILKARQEGFCVDPSTRVLTADLRWVAIKDIEPGQEIVGVDEHPPGGKGASRKMRHAVVQAAQRVQREAYRIDFDDGRHVVCTGRHPWLSKKVATGSKWRKIEGGKERLQVGAWVRWIAKPWEPGGFEDGWFGGLLDGEGTQRCKPNGGFEITVTQVAGAVLDRAEAYLIDRGYDFRVDKDVRPAGEGSKLGSKDVYRLVLHRMNEAFRLFGQTRPSRFISRHWWADKELPGKRTSLGWARIVAITPLGMREMVDLQTSTGTYIAEGFVSHNTTLIDLLLLDQCIWQKQMAAGIIAHTLTDAASIFQRKIQFPYKKLPAGLREKVHLVKDTQSDFQFSNGSAISVGTSFRGGTLQYLHVSEFGKIAANSPKKAIEIVTGAFNTVAPGQWIFVESTAEGRGGVFFNMCQTARQAKDEGRALTKLDFKFHFYAWWRKGGNRLDPDGVVITREMEEYFERVERTMKIQLDPAQRAWYVRKRDQMMQAGGRGAIDGEGLMKREHPSTPDEAFEAAVAGAYYPREMQQLRQEGRLCRIPVVDKVPVNTFWDLGSKDRTVIVFHQKIGPENRIIDFYENSGMKLAHYAKVLADRGYTYGRHFLPHDAQSVTIGAPSSPEKQLNDLGVKPTEIVPRIDKLDTGHEMMRSIFSSLLIDSVRCNDLVTHLDMYRKAWNDTVGDWYDHPVEDEHVHAADAIRQLAQSGASERSDQVSRPRRRASRSWRTV